MAWGEDDDREDEQDEEEDAEDHMRVQNDNIIFLIDARQNMHETCPSTPDLTYFQVALKVALAVMKNKVVMSAKHMVAMVFFGATGGESNGDTYQEDNVWPFLPLAAPDTKSIRQVDNLVKSISYGMTDVVTENKALSEDDICPLRGGIRSCNLTFRDCKNCRKGDYKRVFLFTNQDNPKFGRNEAESNEEKTRILQAASDAKETGVTITVYPMQRGSGVADHDNDQDEGSGKPAFDMTKIYAELERVDGDLDGDQFNQMPLGQQREYKARLTRLPLYITDDVAVDVQVLNLIQPATKPASRPVDIRSNKEVKRVTELINEDTTAPVEPENLTTFLLVGDTRAYITKDELAFMKQLHPPGIVLLGFKPLSDLREDHTLKSPYFLYPDEQRMAGSTTAFAALLKGMLKKQVMGLVRYTRNSAAETVLCLLVPQEEVVDDDFGIQAMREADMKALEEQNTANRQQVAAAEQVLQALQIPDFDCRNYENPMLQKHYAGLQALALGEKELEWKEDKDDYTRPNHVQIDQAAGEPLQALKEACGLGDEPEDIPDPKRKAKAPAGGAPAKKVKREVEDADINWAAEAASGGLQAFTNPQLKAGLKSLGLPVSGKKAELIQRIQNNFA
ncbi:SPOC like C-terminal domain-containing protein [Tribonema minus]|uniref:SPOC like C-terminal domain-containing protein n=1 Tax=Tribonema minus TaxID=303371 RepID=A0A835ZF42_9STRA|nr:SPOC like C-terminal domain-containing protein [Tribonema minus]